MNLFLGSAIGCGLVCVLIGAIWHMMGPISAEEIAGRIMTPLQKIVVRRRRIAAKLAIPLMIVGALAILAGMVGLVVHIAR